MIDSECDIWFGPGGLKGVFGAGVASELQNAIERGEIDPSRLRLFGSSVGCLTAAHLATGNADNGISIFHEDINGLITPSKLVPSLSARLANRVIRSVGNSRRQFTVPNVLDVDHAMAVMMRRCPEIVGELRAARMPAFAESFHVRTGQFHHVALHDSQQPLDDIRDSLRCFPFAWSPDTQVLDSGVVGYGFVDLMRSNRRRLIVVLNAEYSPHWREPFGELLCAMLAADKSVSTLYLGRRRSRRLAIQSARQSGDRVLVIAPERPLRLRNNGDFQKAYDEGRGAARKAIQFVRTVPSV